jgi:hypothetical protein
MTDTSTSTNELNIICRDIYQVHEQIIKRIPESESELINNLNKFIASLWNQAPEVRKGPEVYLPYGDILNYYIPSYDETKSEDIWKKNINYIFNFTNQNLI